jgi:hypothetical protein
MSSFVLNHLLHTNFSLHFFVSEHLAACAYHSPPPNTGGTFLSPIQSWSLLISSSLLSVMIFLFPCFLWVWGRWEMHITIWARKPEEEIPPGDLYVEGNINNKKDLKELEHKGLKWTQWRIFFNLRIPETAKSFLTSCATINITRRYPLHGDNY